MREEFLSKMLNSYIEEVERQNKEYFEGKARDLLEMRKQDPISLIMANLLFKSLNISMDQYIQRLQKSGGSSSGITFKVVESESSSAALTLNKENSSSMSNKDKSLPFVIKK